jgi:5-methylcytosine-specific restriction protein A
VRNTGPSPTVRRSVQERDSGCVNCSLVEGDTQLHHRRPRAAGGTRRPETNSPANLILLCLPCHALVESRREWARERGLLVGQSQTPADVPVLWHGVRVLLCDDGRITPLVEVAS